MPDKFIPPALSTLESAGFKPPPLESIERPTRPGAATPDDLARRVRESLHSRESQLETQRDYQKLHEPLLPEWFKIRMGLLSPLASLVVPKDVRAGIEASVTDYVRGVTSPFMLGAMGLGAVVPGAVVPVFAGDMLMHEPEVNRAAGEAVGAGTR